MYLLTYLYCPGCILHDIPCLQLHLQMSLGAAETVLPAHSLESLIPEDSREYDASTTKQTDATNGQTVESIKSVEHIYEKT